MASPMASPIGTQLLAPVPYDKRQSARVVLTLSPPSSYKADFFVLFLPDNILHPKYSRTHSDTTDMTHTICFVQFLSIHDVVDAVRTSTTWQKTNSGVLSQRLAFYCFWDAFDVQYPVNCYIDISGRVTSSARTICLLCRRVLRELGGDCSLP